MMYYRIYSTIEFIASIMQMDPTNKTCVSSLKLLGDFWTLRIIDTLENEPMRFCDLQRAVDNLNPATLTSRLKRLEDASLVRRSKGTEDGCSVTYGLTELGKKTLPIVGAYYQFTKEVAVADKKPVSAT